jgi:hypothetical protein
LDGRKASQRNSGNFYGSWSDPKIGLSEVGVGGKAVFTLPDHIWAKLRKSASLFYRALTAADRSSNWTNYETSLSDQDSLNAPRIKLVDRVIDHESDSDTFSLRKFLGSHGQDTILVCG